MVDKLIKITKWFFVLYASHLWVEIFDGKKRKEKYASENKTLQESSMLETHFSVD